LSQRNAHTLIHRYLKQIQTALTPIAARVAQIKLGDTLDLVMIFGGSSGMVLI
jgi:hypothetical protein